MSVNVAQPPGTTPPGPPVHYSLLLTDDVTYDGWHVPKAGTADQKAFYIRGYTWYQQNVLKRVKINISDCGPFIPRALEILAKRKIWNDGDFDWTQALAPQQVWKAVSPTKREPVKFQKAVGALAVFEAIAEALSGFDPHEIYEHLWIEPAVWYITDLSKGFFDNLQPDFLMKLKQATGQKHKTVFQEMAESRPKPVTRKLAESTSNFLIEHGFSVGQLEYKYDRRVNYPSSTFEEIGY